MKTNNEKSVTVFSIFLIVFFIALLISTIDGNKIGLIIAAIGVIFSLIVYTYYSIKWYQEEEEVIK